MALICCHYKGLFPFMQQSANEPSIFLIFLLFFLIFSICQNQCFSALRGEQSCVAAVRSIVTELYDRMISAEDKHVPFPFPLLHNTSEGAKCCVRSDSRGRPVEALLQWCRLLGQWRVHTTAERASLQICACPSCGEEFLSGEVEFSCTVSF